MSETTVALGARLKSERERRGLSSAKAADELHLDGWVIDALEAEDYERIGPSVYAKGHLKRYAALLGLPPDEVLAHYESRSQIPKAAAAPAANVRLRTDTRAVSNLPLPQIIGAAAVLLLILGVLWWKPWHERGAVRASSGTLAVAPGAASVESAASSPPAFPDTAAASAPTGASGAGTGAAVQSSAPGPGLAAAGRAAATNLAGGATTAVATDLAAGTGRARLRLSFSADSRVDVHDAAGRRIFVGNGRANSVKVLHGIAPMRVYLGFASGVQLEINDHAVAIGPQFLAGDVAHFEAGADGILRRDSRSTATPVAAAPAAAAPGAQIRNARPSG